MSAMDENAFEGGQNGPPEVSGPVGAALIEAAAYLYRFSESEMSRGAPNELLIERLRSEDARLELADEVLSQCAMDVVAGDLLHEWLCGGVSPFESTRLKAANVDKQSAAKSIERVSDRVARRQKDEVKARAGVTKAEKDLEKARQRLADAEAGTVASRNYEKALVYYELAQHFGKVVAPIFALGPAWTLMRSVSAHASRENLEMHCGLVGGEDRVECEAQHIAERATETEAMLATLDFFSGDVLFEDSLRTAIAKACKEAEKRRPALEKAGRRDRSKTKRTTEVHPMARGESDEVIEGLRRVG